MLHFYTPETHCFRISLLVHLCTNRTGLVLLWIASAPAVKTGTTADYTVFASII